MALSIIQINNLDGISQSIVSDKPNFARVDEFLDYFNNTFFEGKFPIQFWNHYDIIIDHSKVIILRLKKLWQ